MALKKVPVVPILRDQGDRKGRPYPTRFFPVMIGRGQGDRKGRPYPVRPGRSCVAGYGRPLRSPWRVATIVEGTYEVQPLTDVP